MTGFRAVQRVLGNLLDLTKNADPSHLSVNFKQCFDSQLYAIKNGFIYSVAIYAVGGKIDLMRVQKGYKRHREG